jgi:hypothetical protein
MTAGEAEAKRYLLALYQAGKYLELCEWYCHEGWDAWMEAGEVRDGGICSFRVGHLPEDEALARTAAHIYGQILQGILGC